MDFFFENKIEDYKKKVLYELIYYHRKGYILREHYDMKSDINDMLFELNLIKSRERERKRKTKDKILKKKQANELRRFDFIMSLLDSIKKDYKIE